MLAMDARPPRGVRLPASSLTTIETVRRLDVLAPTGEVAFFANGVIKAKKSR